MEMHIHSSLGGTMALLSFLTISYMLLSKTRSCLPGMKAPHVGYRSWWEPTWLLRLRFTKDSMLIMSEGYNKFKDSMFVLRRTDKDVLVISHRNVDQLRNLPEERLSAIDAHVLNTLGHLTGSDILREGSLHIRTIQHRLTPRLASLTPRLMDELEYALKMEVPDCQDWTSVSMNDILTQIICRFSARMFVGPVLCRNQEWIDTTRQYAVNTFVTVMLLRVFPAILRPLIGPLLPSYRRLGQNTATAERLIGSMVRERTEKRGHDEKHDDFLQWMMEDAVGIDGRADKLARRQLVLSLASVHTTGTALTNAVYDLVAHPEYIEPLRAEILAVLEEEGGAWHRGALNKLRKLDSFLKESQRFNPTSQHSFNRVVKQDPLELYDGTILPVGTHFCVAAHAILLDASNVPGGGDPSEFDGFRYSTLREDPKNINKYQWVTTDSSNLHLGHGKYACPGRFFANNELKLILARLMLRYDFKYPQGMGRPKTLIAGEALYPDPTAKVLMRIRKDGPDVV